MNLFLFTVKKCESQSSDQYKSTSAVHFTNLHYFERYPDLKNLCDRTSFPTNSLCSSVVFRMHLADLRRLITIYNASPHLEKDQALKNYSD